MVDLNEIRKNPEGVKNALLKRMDSVDFTEVLGWDKARREAISKADELKARRNSVSQDIPRLKKEGKPVDSLMTEMKQVSETIKNLDAELAELDKNIRMYLSSLPNLPAPDVLAGGKDQNRVIRSWGKKPEFAFKAKDHVDLVTGTGLVDYETGVKIGGTGFWLYRGKGAVLEWALLSYFIREHLADGYEFMLPPHILTYQSGFTAGQFPKFEDDVFRLESEPGKTFSQFMLPTAETALINVHRDEILAEESLPRKYCAYTPCYRKEAGSYRTEERGMIRGHQFNKVEMFQYTTPEQSEAAFEELIGKAERLVQGLGLHYQVVKLAAKDVSASMAKTFDIEVWLPSMGVYKEVSSVSNAHAYQARRGNMRFKRKETGANEYLHTLNASGLATSRILPAIVEQHQKADGSITVPEPLRQWVGTDVLEPVRK